DDPRPAAKTVAAAAARSVDFVGADVASAAATAAAFARPWPAAAQGLPLTVFHTAAAISPFASQRAEHLYGPGRAVNAGGTRHAVAAARVAGADVLVATSSGSIAVRPANFWAGGLPWERRPPGLFQTYAEEDFDAPLRPREEFFANYAASKAEAERIVCA